MSAKGQKRTWHTYSKQRPYSRLLRWAKYFSYSAREITPPSCLPRARSLAGNEAWISSTRFQGASGVSHVERGTYSDGLVFVYRCTYRGQLRKIWLTVTRTTSWASA